MKKNIKFSLIVSLLINIICFLINVIGALLFDIAPLTIKLSGGEIIEHIGFGVLFDEIFPLTVSEQASVITEVHFNLISLIVSFVIVAVIVFLIKTLICKMKGDK